MRLCEGCYRPLPYGSRRRFHSRACETAYRRDNSVLATKAKALGIDPRSYLSALLERLETPLRVATELGVDHGTVLRWCKSYGLERHWGPVVVRLVPVKAKARRMAPPDPRQKTLV